MPSPHMSYETKNRTAYLAGEHAIVSVQPHHVHEMTAMGGIPLLPVVEHPDGSTTPWVDPRIVSAPTK
jgi:hypothetical protein